MKDENAKDCFYCGDPFTTFRRKHHCSKHISLCHALIQKTNADLRKRNMWPNIRCKVHILISGQHFEQSGTLRVCKPCEGIINGEDDSSEFSDDGTLSVRGIRPRHGSTGASDVLGSPFAASNPTSSKGSHRNLKHPDLSVPTMSIPATRKAGSESSRKPTVLEIDAQRTLARPSSSRSSNPLSPTSLIMQDTDAIILAIFCSVVSSQSTRMMHHSTRILWMTKHGLVNYLPSMTITSLTLISPRTYLMKGPVEMNR